MKVIEVDRLRKVFSTSVFQKQIVAVDDLSFSIDAGKIVGFLGANGAGKTTTIKTLLALIKPSSGTVKILGHSPQTTSARAAVGFLPERPYFYEYLTGREFLRFYLSLSGVLEVTEKKISDLLELVGLSHAGDRPLRRYSKGMLQRIGVAQAICHEPKLLILDEPMSGLDPDGRQHMTHIIRQVRDRGTTVFLSSHQLHDVEVLCDEVVMIEKGKLIVQSSVSNLLEKESKGFEVIFRTSDGKVITLTAENENDLQSKIDEGRSRGDAIFAVHPIRPSLEEIFIKYKQST